MAVPKATGLPIFDGPVKSQKSIVFVILASAGIQGYPSLMDSRVRGSGGLRDFSRKHHVKLSLAGIYAPLNLEEDINECRKIR